jgi:hypothetical protein
MTPNLFDRVAAPLSPLRRGVLDRADTAARVLVCSTNDLAEVAEQVETGLTVIP